MKLIQSTPQKNEYFKEYEVENGNTLESTEGNIVNIYDDVMYQEVLGFGGALTEAAAYNYALMDDKTKDAFMRAYFDEKEGIGYNFGRTHINSCDFSLDIYTNVEEGDMTLETFSIERDKKYIIPFIKDAMKYSRNELMLFASPWSPPAYMKENNSMLGGGKLRREHKDLWARYYAKYIKAYAAEGIKISAISVQNEPKALQTWESCYYTAEDERDFIEMNLVDALDEEGLGDVKIIIWDHNKERVYDRAKTILSNPIVNERVWAVGHHWYSGEHFEGLRLVEEQLHKPNICTEFCASIAMTKDLVYLAECYGKEICENMNNFCIGICDWNVLLNETGGPYHNRGRAGTDAIDIVYIDGNAGCYAPVTHHLSIEEVLEQAEIENLTGDKYKNYKSALEIMVQAKSIKVCGQNIPQAEVHKRLKNISYEHLVYVDNNTPRSMVNGQTEIQVINPVPYIISSLYNALQFTEKELINLQYGTMEEYRNSA